MFTGIVEHMGVVAELSPLDSTAAGGNGTSITISNAGPVLVDCHLGDSIAVNGVCLTVTSFEVGIHPDGDDESASTSDDTDINKVLPGHFKVGVAPETLRRTNIGSFAVGTHVNLERAVMAAPTHQINSSTPAPSVTTTVTTVTKVSHGNGEADTDTTKTVTITTSGTGSSGTLGGTRVGGHSVQGHIDTVAVIEHLQTDGNSLRMRFRPRRLGPVDENDDPDTKKVVPTSVTDLSRSVLRHIIEKGFIAIDGTSLTVTRVCDYDPLTTDRKATILAQALSHVKGEGNQGSSSASSQAATAAITNDINNLDDGWFEVMLIAYTQQKVVQARKQLGEWVNIEVDMAAKYIDRSVLAYFDAAERDGGVDDDGNAESDNSTTATTHLPALERLVNRIVEQRLAVLKEREQGKGQ